MTPNVDVSVIVPVHNRSESLRRVLLSLTAQTLPRDDYEIVVVDNDSTDALPQVLAEFSQLLPLRLVHVAKRHGFESCRLRNRGIGASRGRVLLFLDSDMVVPAPFLANHLMCHRRAADVAVLGKMVYLENNDLLTDDVLSGSFDARDLGAHQLVGTTVRNFLALSGNLTQHDRPWQFCIGANFSVSRATVERVGGFDEDLDGDAPAGGDIAYGMKLHARGIRLIYGRWAIGFHQRNHPLRSLEAPDYFAARMASVRRHEQMLHGRYALDEAFARMLQKRSLTQLMHGAGLSPSHATVRRLFPRDVRNGHVRAVSPALSVLLVDDTTPQRLRSLLDAFATVDVDPELFEVLVLDPRAPIEDDACVAGSEAEAVVQLRRVPYALRYYPIGTAVYRQRVTAVEAMLRDVGLNDLERCLLTRQREALRAAYEREMSIVIDDRPNGLASRIVAASTCSNPAGLLRDALAAARQLTAV